MDKMRRVENIVRASDGLLWKKRKLEHDTKNRCSNVKKAVSTADYNVLGSNKCLLPADPDGVEVSLHPPQLLMYAAHLLPYIALSTTSAALSSQ